MLLQLSGHSGMGLYRHIYLLWNELLFPDGHFRVVDEIYEIHIIIDLCHGIKDTHTLLYLLLVLTYLSVITDKLPHIPDGNPAQGVS